MLNRTIVLLAVGGFVILMAAKCFGDAAAQLKQAADYDNHGCYKQSESILKLIIQESPGTADAFKARQRLAILYVVTERTSKATEQIEAMKSEFASNSDLPDALYWIAKRYQGGGYADRATNLYQQITDRYPDSRYAKKAQLDFPRTNILSLLHSGKYTEAEAAIDKLLTDFPNHPELPEALYDIGRACKMSGMYTKAKTLYKYILEHYPNCSYAELCPLQIPKMDIWAMIALNNFTGAETAIEKLTTDFSSDPELPDVLRGIAIRYEELGKYQSAQNLYQQIIRSYPQSKAASKTKIDIEKDKILLLMESGDANAVLAAVDNMIAVFSGDKYLPEVVSREIAHRYYSKGVQFQGIDPNMSKRCFQQAVAVWAKAIDQLPGFDYTAEGACLSGNIYLRLENYQKAADCFQKVVNDCPMYHRRWLALSMAGYTYEQMKQKGLLSAKEADPKIRAAYQEIVEVYSESEGAVAARMWLNNNPL